MAQQGQVFPLAGQGRDGMRWAYRYRVGGRNSRRVQRGGFASEQAAAEALERVLAQLQREQGLVESPTLAEFVDLYLANTRASQRRRRSCAGCSQRRCASSGSGG